MYTLRGKDTKKERTERKKLNEKDKEKKREKIKKKKIIVGDRETINKKK